MGHGARKVLPTCCVGSVHEESKPCPGGQKVGPSHLSIQAPLIAVNSPLFCRSPHVLFSNAPTVREHAAGQQVVFASEGLDADVSTSCGRVAIGSRQRRCQPTCRAARGLDRRIDWCSEQCRKLAVSLKHLSEAVSPELTGVDWVHLHHLRRQHDEPLDEPVPVSSPPMGSRMEMRIRCAGTVMFVPPLNLNRSNSTNGIMRDSDERNRFLVVLVIRRRAPQRSRSRSEVSVRGQRVNRLLVVSVKVNGYKKPRVHSP